MAKICLEKTHFKEDKFGATCGWGPHEMPILQIDFDIYFLWLLTISVYKEPGMLVGGVTLIYMTCICSCVMIFM